MGVARLKLKGIQKSGACDLILLHIGKLTMSNRIRIDNSFVILWVVVHETFLVIEVIRLSC